MTAKTTAPAARLRRINAGAGHRYTLDGEKVPGVTTVLRSLAAPAIVAWAANTTAEYALDHWDELAGMSPAARLTAMKKAANAKRDTAAVRGTRIHALAEKLQAGEEPEVAPELLGPVQAVARFLDAWQIETITSELSVAHTVYRYAGTVDLFARSGVFGCPILLDWKTGKGIYDEHALQLAAYRFADLATDGARDLEVPQVEQVFVAHVGPDEVTMHPIDARKSTFNAFLYLLAVHRWESAAKEDSPIGRATFPEEVR